MESTSFKLLIMGICLKGCTFYPFEKRQYNEEGRQMSQYSHLHCSCCTLCGKVNVNQLCTQVLQRSVGYEGKENVPPLLTSHIPSVKLELFHLLSISFPWKGISFIPVQILESAVQMWSNNGEKLPDLEKTISFATELGSLLSWIAQSEYTDHLEQKYLLVGIAMNE